MFKSSLILFPTQWIHTPFKFSLKKARRKKGFFLKAQGQQLTRNLGRVGDKIYHSFKRLSNVLGLELGS